MKAQRGFTLIEMMVSLVVFSFAIAGVLAVAVSMSQGYKDQRANVTTEGAARVPMDFLADAIRQASPGSPTGVIYDATQSGCTGSNAITATDGGTTAADALDIIYAAGATVTSTYDPSGVGAGVVITAGSITVNVSDASGFSVGDNIVLSNTSFGHYLAVTGVSGTLGGSLTVSSTCSTGTVYPVGSPVIRAQHALFYIDATTNPAVPVLMMNATPTGVYTTDIAASTNQPLADGVEDMQFALAIDTTSSSLTAMTESASANADGWLNNVAGSIETSPVQNAIGSTLRAIRVTLISRTSTQLLGTSTLFTRPAAENRAASTPADNYRRRVLKATVEIRSTGVSP